MNVREMRRTCWMMTSPASLRNGAMASKMSCFSASSRCEKSTFFEMAFASAFFVSSSFGTT